MYRAGDLYRSTVPPLHLKDSDLTNFRSYVRLFGNTCETGNGVETRVEAQDALDPVALHYGDMNGISGREFPFTEYQVLSAFCV